MNRRAFTTTLALGALGSIVYSCKNDAKYPLKKNFVIACLGDSVTAGGGHGYVEILQELADQKYSELNLTFLNWGKSSETITGLTEVGHPGPRPYLFDRFDGLIENNKVDLVLFCYGINCGIYGPPSQKLFNSYKIGVLSFLEKIKAQQLKAVLITPPPLALKAAPMEIDTNADFTWQNPYPTYDKEVLQEFKSIILNTKHEALVNTIDIHTPLSENQSECYDTDPIHPNTKGQELIAHTIMDKLAF